MALYKRNKIYWIDITHNGKRIQQSTGTSDKIAATKFHDKLKMDLWHQHKLGDKPRKTWMDAAVRWVTESSHKKSLADDKCYLRWLDPYFRDLYLDEINKERIRQVAKLKQQGNRSNASANRLLALIRAILNKCVHEWEWLDFAPKVSLFKEDSHRIRWLTPEQASLLISELPEHLADMTIFTLATGLRQSNVKNLKWEDVDLENRHAWVHPDEAKAKKAIAIPLNTDAMDILLKRQDRHPVYVFTYQDHSIREVNTKAWRKALKRSGIENFRWHDLRHTWASWHVQNGTSLQELQQLGGWSSFNMVLRYAHLSSRHLQDAAARIQVTKTLQSKSAKQLQNDGKNDNLLNLGG